MELLDQELYSARIDFKHPVHLANFPNLPDSVEVSGSTMHFSKKLKLRKLENFNKIELTVDGKVFKIDSFSIQSISTMCSVPLWQNTDMLESLRRLAKDMMHSADAVAKQSRTDYDKTLETLKTLDDLPLWRVFQRSKIDDMKLELNNCKSAAEKHDLLSLQLEKAISEFNSENYLPLLDLFDNLLVGLTDNDDNPLLNYMSAKELRMHRDILQTFAESKQSLDEITAREMLLKEFDKIDDKDVKTLPIHGKTFTVNEMIQEVKRQTYTGRNYVRMYLDDLRSYD